MSRDAQRHRLREQLVGHLEGLQRDGVWGLSLEAAGTAAVAADEGDDSGASPRTSEAARPLAGPGSPAAPPPVGFAPDHPDASLEEVEREALACVACRLHEQRTKVVFGVGNPDARLMFIGEGPGRDEDLQGEPFVGRAGQLLTRIIEAMGYRREDVYIANAVKCRPPQNRDPQADEIATCRHFLMRQLALIGPEIVVLLGRSAVSAVLDLQAPLSRLRGGFRDWNGVKVMCTYHPAYLLRNPSAKGMVWEDMKLVRDALATDPAESD